MTDTSQTRLAPSGVHFPKFCFQPHSTYLPGRFPSLGLRNLNFLFHVSVTRFLVFMTNVTTDEIHGAFVGAHDPGNFGGTKSSPLISRVRTNENRSTKIRFKFPGNLDKATLVLPFHLQSPLVELLQCLKIDALEKNGDFVDVTEVKVKIHFLIQVVAQRTLFQIGINVLSSRNKLRNKFWMEPFHMPDKIRAF